MEPQELFQLNATNSSLSTSGLQQSNLFPTDPLQLPNTSSTQSGSLSDPMEAGIAEAAMEVVDYSQSLHDEVLDVFGGMTEVATKIADSNQSLHDEVLDVFAGITEVTGQIVDYNQSLLESGLDNGTPDSPNPVLASALTEAQKQLETFTKDKEFLDKMNLAFDEDLPLQEAQGLIQDLASGETLPAMEVQPAAELEGAEAAYGIETQTIYLSQDFLSENAAKPEAVADVLLEEVGHYVDQALGGGDSPGDEGDIFSRLVQGETLSVEEIATIKQEDDKETISLPGEKEPVEEADPEYPGYDLIYDPAEPVGETEDNEDVEVWQQAMLDQGYFTSPDEVDGLYGPNSVEVAKKFQEAKGLDPDGIVGPLTWEATFSGDVVQPPGDYITEVPLPPDEEINEGLTSPSADYLEELLGNPEDSNSEGQLLQVTQSVGPFEVTGLKPAVEALGRIFDKVEVEKPDLYEQLGTVGMLNVRPIEGTDTYSNHSWGAAIDMRIGDTEADLDKDGATYQGLVELEPYFNAENFYWGAEFSTNEDPIHFEASEELLAQWEAEGLLTA